MGNSSLVFGHCCFSGIDGCRNSAILWFGQWSPDPPPRPLRPLVSQSPTGGVPPEDPRRTKQIRNDSSRDQRALKTNFAACQSETGPELLDRPLSGERDEIDQLSMLFGREKLFPLTQVAQAAVVESWFELVVGYRTQGAGTVPQDVIGHADGSHGLDLLVPPSYVESRCISCGFSPAT